MSQFSFVGIDTETAGLDLDNHRIIQIGVAFSPAPDDMFVSDVGWDVRHAYFSYEQRALDINKFTLERIDAAPRWLEVRERLNGFLEAKLKEKQAKEFVAVGWNVSGFDLPRITKIFPEFPSYFSYRTVDLNAICFALSSGREGRFKKWKSRAKKIAAMQVGHSNEHDAGWDALTSLLSFQWLQARLADVPLPLVKTDHEEGDEE